MTPATPSSGGPEETRAAARRFADLARDLVATERNVFWLDAGEGATSGVSYLGAGARVLLSRDGRTTVDGRPVAGDAIAALRPALADAPTGPGGHPFRGGWVGWFSYEYGADLVGVPRAQTDLPDALLVQPDRLWAFDHGSGTVEQVLTTAREPVPPVARATSAPSSSARPQPPTVTWRHDRAAYLSAIEACQAAIARGDAYQVCLTNEARVSDPGDAFEAYERLRASSPAPHGAFLRIGDVAVASSSPERFLRVDGRRVVTRPIKGTRPRGADSASDAALARELRSDEKERAENLMIVDLMRNDLGRVARLGSVEVEELFSVESFSSVHQLVSTVAAVLDDDRDALDALAASFPAGSMTGAPKHRAMTILAGLESGPRGAYAGTFGWIGADGGLDLAMVIRSIVFAGGEARIGTGGGITALSKPESEVAETLLKARPLLAALGLPAELAAHRS